MPAAPAPERPQSALGGSLSGMWIDKKGMGAGPRRTGVARLASERSRADALKNALS